MGEMSIWRERVMLYGWVEEDFQAGILYRILVVTLTYIFIFRLYNINPNAPFYWSLQLIAKIDFFFQWKSTKIW